jgi:hypothetical protein
MEQRCALIDFQDGAEDGALIEKGKEKRRSCIALCDL